MATAMVFIMLLSSLPPKNMVHRDNKTTALAMVAAMVLIKISLCLIWDNSWAMTPSNSSLFNIFRIPDVTATAAWSSFLPVANALGLSVSYTHLRAHETRHDL